MKKTLLLIICLIGICSTVYAADTFRCDPFLDEMLLCGMIKGSDKGLELEKSLTRAEAAVFCTRLMGAQYEAIESFASHPFTDVPDWAAYEIGYLYENGYVNGTSDTRYEPDAPLTSQQFYAMLLRCLGYSEKNGDFQYEEALSFARMVGLLSDTESKYITDSFTRDGAVVAMYNALQTVPKGESEPLCKIISKDINSSFPAVLSEVILGTSKTYNVLRDAVDTMDALENYTMKQTGSYLTKTNDRSTSISESYECIVYSDLTQPSTVYETELETTVAEKSSVLSEILCGDANLILLSRNENGTNSVDFYRTPGKDAVYAYAAVHHLFKPDYTYVTQFDYSETPSKHVLEGFLCRYDLLYDITSKNQTSFYYDVRIEIDKKTNLIQTVKIVYDDIWIGVDEKPIEVTYHTTFTFYDCNQTNVDQHIERVMSKLGYTAS